MTFLTTGTIAKALNEDRDVVSYAIRKLGIQPQGKAGIANVYGDDALEAVRKFLSRKGRKHES